MRGPGTAGTVVGRQSARVYQFAVPGRDQLWFYAESRLDAASVGPVSALVVQ